MYLEFVRQQKAFEKEREEQLEGLYMMDAEREWKRREQKWNQESLARERLMENVRKTRQEQINARSMSGFICFFISYFHCRT